jgi:hypothetical protein
VVVHVHIVRIRHSFAMVVYEACDTRLHGLDLGGQGVDAFSVPVHVDPMRAIQKKILG